MQVSPKDFHISAHTFLIVYAIRRTNALDFLSEKAQRSIAAFMSEGIRDFYHYWNQDERYRSEREDRHYDSYQYFQRVVLEHPLGDLFGEKFARLVDKSCCEVYDLLEQGKDPILEDKREQ